MMGGDLHRCSIEEYETPAVGVVESLSDIKETEPEELAPLYRTLDPDGLNKVIESGTEEVTVVFEHGGCSVKVRADETVLIETPDED
ncbi:HalOD1 output domain-containing protein [Natrononativus amylolyticus]|uniref:HalOD1 output domain-containing protein n=1 Tax=Natrononativus amylolyticus TaxID=2963434 RepID=UPI0020CC52D8|nr:HalOD1 output domain-containing protein [Natrononativus amylolyticus]